MKSRTNNLKKIPAGDEAERGRIHLNNADTVRQNDDLVHWPRLLNTGFRGHGGNPNWN